MITRRQALASALGAAALAASPAFAQGQAVGTIRVEALPSVVEAWGSNLPIVKAELERTLVEILGPSLQRGAGTRLVVTIGRVWLSSSTRGTGWAGANEDYLESTATLYDRSGRQLASYPIRSTESATGAGLLRLPEADQFRLRALARNNAWWVRRYIAG
ncbi:hypothetical protein [Bosea sp. ANAM02]|uniref:hypothetical protein n=1 Tax=Bosea sp. ANAM02 TaxID=2020412 RepID=UPI00140F38B0|nr:hypothetical protein [Bosea sp. ANAM02]BCB18879.1 hypothetical protein OCUBac02_17730 [Bosea sp. ANAM02]